MRHIEFQYLVIKQNGFVLKRCFDLDDLVSGFVKTWLAANRVGEKDLVIPRQLVDYTLEDRIPIFEGDVVKHDGEIQEVYWDDSYAQYRSVSTGTWSDDFWTNNVDVVGNIFEHPELLEEYNEPPDPYQLLLGEFQTMSFLTIPEFRSTQDKIDWGLNTQCDCPWHKKQKRFFEIINKLNDTADQEWMIEFLDWACQIDESLSMEQDYVQYLLDNTKFNEE